MSKEGFIQLKNVGFAYEDGSFSLDDIELDIAGEGLTLLSGLNGSGKSTLCKLIVGLLQPQKGSIYINGEDASALNLAQRGRYIGYLFQNPAQQIFAPEVSEELSFIPRLLGWEEERIEARKQELLRFFALTHREHAATFYLSRGEKQRLALAGILFTGPPFLILDEPTTGLDEENREKLAQLLQALLDEGKGVLLISHDAPFVGRFQNMRRITLRNGRIEP